MGIFSKSEKVVSETEFSWNKNKIEITQDGYLRSEGLINVVRIPLRHIDTVTYGIVGVKDVLTPDLHIIGQGVVLGTLRVGSDLINEIQDWILSKIEK